MNYGTIVAAIFIVLVIIGWIIAIPTGIVHFVAFIMCVGKKNCKKDDCRFRGFCSRTATSDKERERMRKKLDELVDTEEEKK